MLEQQTQFNRATQRAANFDRSRLVDVATVLGVVICVVLIELARRKALAVPVPFLIRYGSVALAAGYSGLRVALISASIVATFVIHSSMVGYGPASLTAGPFQVSCGILIGFAIAVLIGRRRDNLIYLANTLESSQMELIAARGALAARAETKTLQLDDATAELTNVEMLLENTVLYSPFAVVVISERLEIKSVNPAGLTIFGLESVPADWKSLGTFMQNIHFFTADNHELEFDRGPIYQALTNATITDDFICRIIRKHQTKRWLRGCFAPDGSVCGATAIFVDISEQKHAEHRLKNFVLRVLKTHEDDRLCLDIVDDGCGFDVDKTILGPSSGDGLGLITMRERAIVVGGDFKVISAPGQGTTVTVCFPQE